jgi:hypothetical protein
MTVKERTRQQLDPAGSIGTRIVTGVIAVASFGYSITMVLLNLNELSTPIMTALALAASAGSGLTVIIGSGPSRAPLRKETFALAAALGNAAIILSAAGTWSTNALVRNDWAAAAMGIILMICGPYRPARELLVAGAVSTVLVSFITLLEYPWYSTEAPVFAFMVLAAAPVLAMCLAGVAYSRAIVGSIERWQRRASAANLTLALQARDGIARSVQQDRVTILNRDVLPFFRDVIARGRIDEATRATARRISESIRSVMVSEADRSWLETVLDSVLGPDSGRRVSVHDPDHLASAMAPDQRVAIRTLLVALLGSTERGAADLTLSVWSDHALNRVRLSATLASSEYAHRLTLAPYLAVVRAVFRNVDIDFTRSTLTMEFSYE